MSEILLEARNIFKQFHLPTPPLTPPKTINALNGVNLSLCKGETLGIAGESGCGKSTIAKIILGLEEPTSGEVFFQGTNINCFSKAEKLKFRRNVQMVFQDPYSSLNPRMRVGEIIGEPLTIHGLARGQELRQRVLALMEQVGLSQEHFDRYPHQFSGGQRQRIGVARALALTPEIIIADEPLSALDISIQAQIINLFIDLQKRLGLSYILISHDLAVIRHLSTKVAVMYLGRVVELAKAEDIFSGSLHPYTKALLAAIPGFNTDPGHMPLIEGDIPLSVTPLAGCPFHPRCPFRKDLCKELLPELEEKRDHHFAACHFSCELPVDKHIAEVNNPVNKPTELSHENKK
ncbi:MAG: ATP-binding cassette domain-containing protein [Geobacteraceae bacterium]|nr:ATP-binding cassette domain-containing protein [Geobacteraceae bacterium]